MNYIVFDLEWNQCPYGKEYENERLPFEIIEIGAVKLNEQKEYLDSFRALIRPRIYRKLHYQTSRIIGLKLEDLQKGEPFVKAAGRFLDWCGDDCRFCTWGTLDLMELQRNLRYYHMEERLPGPILYEDVQKLFAIAFENRKERRALSYAVEYLNLPEDREFHLAKEDAAYTALVLQKIPDDIIIKNYSIDCYQNPKKHGDEIRIRYETYEKYISREFATKEALMSDREVTEICCFACGQKVRKLIRYFPDGSGRNYLGVGKCPEHGPVKCKIRIREAENGRFYAIRTTRLLSEEDLEGIRKKITYLRLKRLNRRRK